MGGEGCGGEAGEAEAGISLRAQPLSADTAQRSQQHQADHLTHQRIAQENAVREALPSQAAQP